MPPRKRRVPNVEPPPPEENPGAYVVVVHDRSISTTNALARVCDAYLVPIIERLKTLADTDNVQIARLVYTKPSLAESPELVSYKSGFTPVGQAMASMKVGAPGEPTDALALVDAIMLALQMFDAQLTRCTSTAHEPILHILVVTSNPPQMTANRQDDRSLSQWQNAPLQILQRKAGLSLILLSPPNRHLLAFFEQIASEPTMPWFPVRADEVHLWGLSEHVASAQPNAPQPQGRKRRRDDEEEDNGVTPEGERLRKSSRKSARPTEKTLPPTAPPFPSPPTTTDPPTQSQPPDSRPDVYSGTVEPSAPAYVAGPAIGTSPMHPTDAVTAVDSNGGGWAALADLGMYLNQSDIFGQANIGGQYVAESPDLGALFSDQSLVAASYAQLTASAGVQQFPNIQGGSSSDIPFNPPAGNQHDPSTSIGQIRTEAATSTTRTETGPYTHSAVPTAGQYSEGCVLTDAASGGAESPPGHAFPQLSSDTTATTSNRFSNTIDFGMPGREEQLPAQHFRAPQTIHFTPTTPSRVPSQLQSGHPQYASPHSRSQVLGPSNLSTLPKASESSLQPASVAGRLQPAENLSTRAPTIGNPSMQSFSPRHTPQQFLQQISPRAQSHHTPSSTASHDSPSASSKAEAVGDKEDSNQPIFNSGHLVGGSPSKVTLMVAISVDDLFFDGPTPKRLRVPITVISSPDQNVRTDLWPKPAFAVTPESLSGPVIWQEFFTYLAKARIPTCSLRANTRTAGGIRAFEVDYLASFDRTCRMLIERTSFARVPFRVPGGPPEAGIALFPSIEQQGAGVSLHAAYFGNINIPRAEDISPSAKTKKEPKEPSDTLPASATAGIPPSPLRKPSVVMTPIHTASPVGIVPQLPYSPPVSVAGPSTLPPGPQIQPALSHSMPHAQLISGSSYRTASTFPPPPRVSPYAVSGRGMLPQRSTSYSVYSPAIPHQSSSAYRPSIPPRVATAPYVPTIGTWSSSPIVSSPDTQTGQYGVLSPRQGTHSSTAPASYNIPASAVSGGNADGSASSQAQPVAFSQPIYGMYEPQQPPIAHFATPVRNHQIQMTVPGQPPRPPYPPANFQRGQPMANTSDAAGASTPQGVPYTPLVGPLSPPPGPQSQTQSHPQGRYVRNPYPYEYPYSQS